MGTTITGRDVQVGQTIKDTGRWYTVTEFDTPDDWTGSHDLRLAWCATSSGAQARLVIFDGDQYATREPGKAAPVVITIRDHATGTDVTVEIGYRRRSYGGWNVTRADNGRVLGWVCHGEHGWSAHVAASAFKGDGPAGEGDLLDEVPLRLFRGDHQLSSRSIGTETKRDDAAEMIIRQLVDYSAPGAGFGARYDVRRWADR
jgi:hypothetical protein